MAREFTTVDARRQELQNMKLVVDVGDGKTIEIPLKGHLILHDCGGPSQAAACDAPITAAAGEQGRALAESQDAEAKNYDTNMRGWMMTVATLFVGISFQALSQRPSWMPDPNDGFNLFLGRHGSNSTDPAQREAKRVVGYVLLNTATFATSLVVVVLLLLPNITSAKRTMRVVRLLMVMAAIVLAFNFSFMISKSGRIMIFALILIVLYGVATVMYSVSVTAATKSLATYVTRRQRSSGPGV